MSKAPGARQTAKAEREAEASMNSPSRASESAVATTLVGVNFGWESLWQNTPVMYHISGLLEKDDWKAVLVTSAMGRTKTSTAAGASGDKPERRLRPDVKKFGDLQRQLHVKGGTCLVLQTKHVLCCHTRHVFCCHTRHALCYSTRHVLCGNTRHVPAKPHKACILLPHKTCILLQHDMSCVAAKDTPCVTTQRTWGWGWGA